MGDVEAEDIDNIFDGEEEEEEDMADMNDDSEEETSEDYEEGEEDISDYSNISSSIDEVSVREVVSNLIKQNTLKQATQLVTGNISKSGVSLLKDLASVQLGQMEAAAYTRRRSDSADLLRRLATFPAVVFQHNSRKSLRVNSLNFNQSGSKLASASYDETIVVWDWEKRRELFQFHSGHHSDMFQAKFLPGDLMIISCARDGQVRLVEVAVTGEVKVNQKIGKHKKAAHRMSLVGDCPYLVLSAGRDGQVLSVDIREMKSESLLQLKWGSGMNIPLDSIHSNSASGTCFCTSGGDQFIRIYDRRFLAVKDGAELLKFTPDNQGEFFEACPTSSAFSDDGQSVVGSYSDETIYLFNTSDPEGSAPVHQYQGHRNAKSLMGVQFYGQQDKYIISGSDCGNIFIWEKETEKVATLIPMAQDRLYQVDKYSHGLVVEPHPSLPVLATSGEGNVVKMWMPMAGAEEGEQEQFMLRTVHENLTEQKKTRYMDLLIALMS